MRWKLRVALVSSVAFVLGSLNSSVAHADGPEVERFHERYDTPGFEIRDHQFGAKRRPKRDSRYSGRVERETAPPTKPAPTLRSDMSLDEYVKTICSNQDEFFEDVNTYIPACGPLSPAQQAQANPPQQQAAAEAYARDYLQRVVLDKPRPVISAQRGGICGVEHSLDLRMRTERIFQDASAPYGTLDIHAYAVNTVDWGDGTVNRYTTSGGPWPNMSISHFWTHRGVYNINVTSVWTAHWSMGPYSGVLSGLAASGSIDNFRVWEAQAMLVK